MANIRLSVLAAAIFLGLFASISSAQVTEEPYCAEDEEYQPNGRILPIGERYFRICSGSHLRDISYLRPGASLTRVLPAFNTIYNWNGLEILRQPRYRIQPADFIRMLDRREFARIHLGDVEYAVFAKPPYLDNAIEAIAIGRSPERATYYFAGSDDLDLPEHIMNCSGQPFTEIREKYSCKVYFRYRSGEDIFIQEDLSWDPEWVRPGGIFVQEPFDFDNLPNQIRGLMHIVRQIDVTVNIEDLRGYVEIVD